MQDEQALLGVLQAVAKALECTVNQHTEVVVHNLRQPESSIIEIVNGHVSGRHVGSAIIAGPDGVQKAFAVGETVAQGVTLAAVGADHVELSRGGARMTLSFPELP